MSLQSALYSKFQYEIVPGAQPICRQDIQAYVYILGATTALQRKKEVTKISEIHCPIESIKDEKRVLHFMGVNGPVWILQNDKEKKTISSDLFNDGCYAWFRDQSGALAAQFKIKSIENIQVDFLDANEETMRAFIIGLEMGNYNFLNSYKNENSKKIKIFLRKKLKSQRLDKKLIMQAQTEARSILLARHLVNLPPNSVNPQIVQDIIKKELHFPKNLKINIWDQKKLAAENMNLHIAVGKGSETPPRMIHIQYRPAKKNSKKPIAFVGKGITFDTGGLDLKPSSAMRLMKKDMGGAAAVLGLAYWVIHSRYERACDFYLALAENSVDAKSMRPSDVYRSRSGHLIEIDNTDAEGRLVLADVMDVAVTRKGPDEPDIVIDIATLTGAIKVALGAEVAGLFSNDDRLAQQLHQAGLSVGEPCWRMPLIQKYFGSMSSNFADFKNSADGFGGAITAALFLEKFCAGKKWAHLDVYCWNDKPTGALGFAGGNGQPVQSMIQWLKEQT